MASRPRSNTRTATAADQQIIEIEVRYLDELEQALANGAEAILLDNMSVEDVKRAVDRCSQHRLGDSGARIPLECSGGIRLENVRAYAETGVEFHFSRAADPLGACSDMSMRVFQSDRIRLGTSSLPQLVSDFRTNVLLCRSGRPFERG